jgi:hypothetical protein
MIWLLCGTALDTCHQFHKGLAVVLAMIDDVICNKENDLSVAWRSVDYLCEKTINSGGL